MVLTVMKRCNTGYKKPHRESHDNNAASAQLWLLIEWLALISQYSPDEVYNCDETGLYYRALLRQHTHFAMKKQNHVKK